MKALLFLFILLVSAFQGVAQKYVAEKSFVSFFSDAAIEDITADNTKTSSLFNAATGDIAFSVPIRSFTFQKSLMQQHFNEKYMDSEKYPKSTFQGKLEGFDANGTGIQNVKARGRLSIKGVTHDVEIPGTVQRQGDKILMKSKFIVKLEDYKIEIPQLLWQNIAEQVEVTVDFTYKLQ